MKILLHLSWWTKINLILVFSIHAICNIVEVFFGCIFWLRCMKSSKDRSCNAFRSWLIIFLHSFHQSFLHYQSCSSEFMHFTFFPIVALEDKGDIKYYTPCSYEFREIWDNCWRGTQKWQFTDIHFIASSWNIDLKFFTLTIVIFLLLGTFDEQKNTSLCRNEFFGFMPS